MVNNANIVNNLSLSVIELSAQLWSLSNSIIYLLLLISNIQLKLNVGFNNNSSKVLIILP